MFRKLFVAVFFVMVFSPAFGQAVQVFVTSATVPDGNLGGLAGGDATCTSAATAAGLPGTWTAWLSTTTTDARDRIIDAAYELLDETVVANSKADLLDGTLDVPINRDENGTGGVNSRVYTGTQGDGTLATNAQPNCQDWTTNGGSEGSQTGDSTLTTSGWTNTGGLGCGSANGRLYCFANFQVPVELEEFSVE